MRIFQFAFVVVSLFVLTGATCTTSLPNEDAGIVVEKDLYPGRASRISGDTPDQYTLLLASDDGHTFIVNLGDSLWAYDEWQRIQLGYFCEEGEKNGFTRWHCESATEEN